MGLIEDSRIPQAGNAKIRRIGHDGCTWTSQMMNEVQISDTEGSYRNQHIGLGEQLVLR